ncbi:MAG: DNA translocase FtsK [Succinivibrionaceae bacterium]
MEVSEIKTKPAFEKIREGCAIILMLVSILVALSLISYNPMDNNWKNDPDRDKHITNTVGFVGANLSDALFSYFGYCAYIIPIMLFYVAILILKQKFSLKNINYFGIMYKILGIDFILLSLCSLVSKMHFFNSGGGHLGTVAYDFVSSFLGYIGTMLSMMGLFFIGISLFTGISIVTMLSAVGGCVISIITYKGFLSVLFKPFMKENEEEQFMDVFLTKEQDKVSIKEIDISKNSNINKELPKKDEKNRDLGAFSANSQITNNKQEEEDLEIPGLNTLDSGTGRIEPSLDINDIVEPIEENKEPNFQTQKTKETKEESFTSQEKTQSVSERKYVSSVILPPPSNSVKDAIYVSVKKTEELKPLKVGESIAPVSIINTSNDPASVSVNDSLNQIEEHINDIKQTLEPQDHPEIPEFVNNEVKEDDDNVYSIDSYRDMGSIPDNFSVVAEPVFSEKDESEGENDNESGSFVEDNLPFKPTLNISVPPITPVNANPEARFVKNEDVPSSVNYHQGHYEYNDDLSDFPPVEIFSAPHAQKPVRIEVIEELVTRLDNTLKLYKIKAHVAERQITDAYGNQKTVKYYEIGPVITRFYLELVGDQRSSRIEDVSCDIARNLRIANIRVILSVPGTSYVAIEIPNQDRQNINMRELLESPDFINAKAPLSICLGRDIIGKPVIYNLAAAPHLLVAGTTGSGKSVGINTMLVSLLMRNKPEDLRLIMIDPKMLEFSNYRDIPHLITPVITDMKKASSAIRWAVQEMERRYTIMSRLQVRNINGYNEYIESHPDLLDPTWHPSDSMDASAPKLKKFPYIVIVVDEFADLVLQLKKNGNIEEMISRLAAKARAAGMHLILATQSPRKEVITGTIRSNFPSQISFKVKSNIESRIVLDNPGAEHLLGRGDMLIKFNDGTNELRRAHGAFISDDEINNFADAWRARGKPNYNDDVSTVEFTEETAIPGERPPVSGKSDNLIDKVMDYCKELKRTGKGTSYSVSGLQRRFSIGYTRAARITDTLEEMGVLSGPLNGSGVREVLIDGNEDS